MPLLPVFSFSLHPFCMSLLSSHALCISVLPFSFYLCTSPLSPHALSFPLPPARAVRLLCPSSFLSVFLFRVRGAASLFSSPLLARVVRLASFWHAWRQCAPLPFSSCTRCVFFFSSPSFTRCTPFLLSLARVLRFPFSLARCIFSPAAPPSHTSCKTQGFPSSFRMRNLCLLLFLSHELYAFSAWAACEGTRCAPFCFFSHVVHRVPASFFALCIFPSLLLIVQTSCVVHSFPLPIPRVGHTGTPFESSFRPRCALSSSSCTHCAPFSLFSSSQCARCASPSSSCSVHVSGIFLVLLHFSRALCIFSVLSNALCIHLSVLLARLLLFSHVLCIFPRSLARFVHFPRPSHALCIFLVRVLGTEHFNGHG